jgi:hypothetical protein
LVADQCVVSPGGGSMVERYDAFGDLRGKWRDARYATGGSCRTAARWEANDQNEAENPKD